MAREHLGATSFSRHPGILSVNVRRKTGTAEKGENKVRLAETMRVVKHKNITIDRVDGDTRLTLQFKQETHI